MREYMENGAQLRRLIDPANRTIEVYWPDGDVIAHTGVRQLEGEGSVVEFVLDLNQVKIVFGMMQRKVLTGASFTSEQELRDMIEAYMRRHNERAKPFKWRKREVKGSQLWNTVANLCD